MKRHLFPLLAVVVLLAGCSATGDVAVDGTGGGPEPSPSDAPESHPTGAPWPAYDVADYTYTLRTMCFCIDGGVPVLVTVRDGKVTDAVYARRGSGHAAGEPAGDWMRVTINDAIDAANRKNAYQVRVHWPSGQDYPSSVWVDPDANAADEEFGYTIRDVSPS